jgi:hypothetical protein
MQISKSNQVCTQHTCVIFSAGKFIAIFRGELSHRSARSMMDIGLTVKGFCRAAKAEFA